METIHLRYLAWFSAALLLIAILPLPYGYYRLLRIVICLVGVGLAFHRYERGAALSAAFLALAAIVFNPILPLHFEREIWAGLNALAALGFIAVGARIR